MDTLQTRLAALNNKHTESGAYVVYWMQHAQRAEYNHALEYAVSEANSRGLPLFVFFGLFTSYPEANLRHFTFMIEGLAEVSASLKERGIPFIIQQVEPDKGIAAIAAHAALVVTDRGYLNIHRRWRTGAATLIECPLIQVETDVIVPVEIASPKEEYTAGTFRPKINRVLPYYLEPVEQVELKLKTDTSPFESIDVHGLNELIDGGPPGNTVKACSGLKGGTSRARALLQDFITHRLDSLETDRNDPSREGYSSMGPYLHFGQISPLYIALEVERAVSPGGRLYLEELIVRRELSMNFTHYNHSYDSIRCLPNWALRTLEEHSGDPRDPLYSLEQLENADTGDEYWNAAQMELNLTGRMHGYMRMYWGKKIIEWTASPEEAFWQAVYLNNKFALDGRDPNSYAGIAWCFGKHDRAWSEREIFGKVRYMNARGLERKFDIKKYVEKVMGKETA